MPEVLLDGKVELHCGDSLKFLKDIPNNWFDSIVCDPPYALVSIVKRLGADNAAPIKVPAGGSGAYARASAGFMGKKWDTGETAFAVEFWAECLRVLKPGGHVVAFGGTRTYHRLACAIEDAGFEIRDMVSWTYGSGFPKSHNVSKNIDKRKFGSGEVATFKAALAEAVVRSGKTRKKINEECGFTMRFDVAFEKDPECWGCSLPTAEQYDAICRVLACGGDVDGLIALREWPRTRMEKLYKVVGYEARQNSPNGIVSVGRETVPILRELTAPGTVEAAEWEGWGTALKPAVEPICLARKPLIGTVAENVLQHGVGALNIDGCRVGEGVLRSTGNGIRDRDDGYRMQGGVIGGSELGRWPANLVHDGSDEVLAAFPDSDEQNGVIGGQTSPNEVFGARGARPRAEPRCDSGSAARFFYQAKADSDDRLGSKHPTVKPVDLMQWLVRLVTPKYVPYCFECEERTNYATFQNQPAKTSNSETVRGVRNAVRSARREKESEQAVLQPLVSEQIYGEESCVNEGVRNIQEGVSPPMDADASASQSAGGLHIRASLGSSTESPTSIDRGRGGSPHQRDQNGQSAGKPSTYEEGRARRLELAQAEHLTLSALRGPDNHQSSCSVCGAARILRRGIVFDPFAGTGTTGEAAFREGMRCVLVEREAEYQDDIRRRMRLALGGPEERRRESIKAKNLPMDAGPLFDIIS